MSGESVRIFLADDNASDVFLVRRAMEQQGILHQLTVSNNGEEALRLLKHAESDSNLPQLILLDLHLPKVTGAEILSYIRRTPAYRATLVIVLTASDTPQDRESVHAMGASYFRKPSDLRSFMELGQVIDDMLKGSASLRTQ